MTAVRALLLLVGVLSVVGCAALAPGPSDEGRVAAVGRITDMDANHGYAIVEFPNGNRMFVTMDKRDMGHYIVGDELRIDSFGRPLPPLPRPVPTLRPS